MLTKITAADYMTKNLVTVSPDTEVFHALKKLLDHKITSMPVVDQHNKLVGTFSEKNSMKVVVEAAYNQGMAGKVGDFMTKEPLVVNADANLVDIANQFQETPTRSFPVFQDGELVGMISRMDVLRAFVSIC